MTVQAVPSQQQSSKACIPAPKTRQNGLRLADSDPPLGGSETSGSASPPRPPAGVAEQQQHHHYHDQQQLQLARVLAERSRFEDALGVLSEWLAACPEDAEALVLQGKCLAGLGRKPQALAALAAALALQQQHVGALLACAAVYKETGLLDEALVASEQAAAACGLGSSSTGSAAAAAVGLDEAHAGDKGSPANGQAVSRSDQAQQQASLNCAGSSSGAAAECQRPQPGMQAAAAHRRPAAALAAGEATQVAQALAVIHTDLGTQKKLAGHTGWEQHYRAALEAWPEYAPAHYNLGVAAAERGDLPAAAVHYRRATELEPRYAEAWCNLGVILRSQGRLEEALAAYDAALASAPNSEVVAANLAAALTERGTQLKLEGRLAEGIAAYERALALRPRHADALYNLGVAAAEQGQRDRAMYMYEAAVYVNPSYAEAHNNLGVLLRETGNVERAIACYEAAIRARPSFPQGLNNLAVVYTQQGRAQQALHLLQAAIMAAPTYAEAYNNLGVLQRDVGLVHEAIASYERCLELDPGNRNAGQNRLLALNYVHPGEKELVCLAHAEWGERFQRQHQRLPPLTLADVDTTPCRPVVVGYISPDLFTHSVSYFAEAPLTHHSPQRVRLVVYSCVAQPDSRTQRLRTAVAAAGGLWRDVACLSEAQLAAAVREDKVDVLVELSGHTALNRLGTMAMRPAPLQVTWIGYPNSTGLQSIDYRLTDATCDPLDTQQTFTEQLVRLPGCFLCYTPPPDAPDVAPPPALANGFVTFGSFNALAKQTPEVLRVWARILQALPGSRLVLKNKPFACGAVQAQFWRTFEEAGVERSRVDLLPLAPSNAAHLAQYSLVDISLDPWPYAGTTTTAESLFMGVPCLTLAGACHAHNVGASLLSTVGLGKRWVAQTVEEYVQRAVSLARDLHALAGLRSGLRQRMLASQLCDGPGFVSRLEGTYQQLWQRWLASAGSAPAGNGTADA